MNDDDRELFAWLRFVEALDLGDDLAKRLWFVPLRASARAEVTRQLLGRLQGRSKQS